MDNDKVKLRRYQDDLNVGGLGVVILGAWSILKIIMHTIIEAKNNISLEEFAEEERWIAVVVVIVVIAGILLLCRNFQLSAAFFTKKDDIPLFPDKRVLFITSFRIP